MSAVATLPTRITADAAFERYADLIRQVERDPALRTDLEHNIAIARAWEAWRDLFLALDRAC